MEDATRKQVIALKKFAKNPELRGIIGGKQFDELNKSEASDLIGECIEAINSEN